MNKLSLIISCAILITGCVGHYQQPSPTAPHATLNAKWGSTVLMPGGFQGYWAYNDAHCQDTKDTGVLGPISESETGSNRFLLQPDKRIYLTAMSSSNKKRETADEPLIHRACMNISSFIPEAGATYQVTHSTLKSGCSLELLDVKTGKTPASLIVESITKECGL